MACGSGCSTSQGRVDGGSVCPSVDTGSYCQPWADLVANPSCGNHVTSYGQFSEDSYTDCGPYHVHQVQHVDTFEVYYYDVATGDCVAAYAGNGGASAGNGGGTGALCSAGPPAGITGPCAPGGPGPWTPNTGICASDSGGSD
jgi:hypothetical protein